MKVLGIQIKSTEAVLVVLVRQSDGSIVQTNECTKFGIADIYDSVQVRHFKEQVRVALDSIKPDRIGICKRNENGRGKMAPSPASFKLEGMFQLYDKVDILFVAPQTTAAFIKRTPCPLTPSKGYQGDALNVAFYLLSK